MDYAAELPVLLDGEFLGLRSGVALNGAGDCYTVRLKQSPADIAAYVHARFSIADGDWWWTEKSGAIEVSVRAARLEATA